MQQVTRLALQAGGVGVASIRRAGGSVVASPDDSLVVSIGDTLVLSGLPEALALAEERLMA